MEKITQIKARVVKLNSGQTITVEVATEHNFSGKVTLPAGISVGQSEAKLLSSVQAINNIEKNVVKAVVGQDCLEQREIDQILMDLDGTIDRSKLGVNSLLPISLAVCRAAASAMNRELYEHIAATADLEARIPESIVVILEGGAHARVSKLPIQEFSYIGNIGLAMKLHQEVEQILKKKKIRYELGSQGGWDADTQDNQTTLSIMMQAAEKLKMKGLSLALDIAASHDSVSRKQIEQLINKFPIKIVEDPIEQSDLGGWMEFTRDFGREKLIAADDLTVGDPVKIKDAVKDKVANCLVIKLNQAATLSEMFDLINLVKVGDWSHIVSHRGHESMDDFIVDLAVGTGANYLKAGTTLRPERNVKYQRLAVIAKNFS